VLLGPEETFVRAYHARHPGVTARAFAHGRGPDGRSTYQILRDLAGHGPVLDLGCGDGYLLELLAGAGHARLVGVDLSEAELAAARRRRSLAGALLIQARAQALPLASGCFGACVSHLAFMLMADIEAVTAELARVLAPGGRFATVVGGAPAADDAFELFLRAVVPVVDSLPAAHRSPRLGDKRTRYREGLDELLGPVGFGAVTFEGLVIDLGGPVDAVWATLSTIYELHAVSPAGLAAIKESFEAEVDALARPDGTVPCTMRVGVAVAERR